MEFDPLARRWEAFSGRVAWRDLGVVGLATLLVVALALIGELLPAVRPLRALVGVGYVLLAPGYCLVAAFFPRRREIDGLERLGLSLGLGVALVVVLALVLDRLGLGLGTWPVVLGTSLLTGALAAAALWRRSRLTPGQQLLTPVPAWRSAPPSERRMYAGIAVVLALVTALAGWTFLIPSADEYMTEFYALGPTGLAEAFPYTARQNEPVAATLVIVNREAAPSTYGVEIWLRDTFDPSVGERLAALPPVRLERGEAIARQASWTMPVVGGDQRVDILLFRDELPDPYRQLRLWIDVRE